jgi:dipeptidyl aminopeptidase/acylaminoacyl peptidase
MVRRLDDFGRAVGSASARTSAPSQRPGDRSGQSRRPSASSRGPGHRSASRRLRHRSALPGAPGARPRAPSLAASLLLCLAIVPVPVPAQESEPGTRLLTFDDILRLEGLAPELGLPPVAFSPDGEQVAFVRLRPATEAAAHDHPFLRRNHRADIWVASTAGGDPAPVTPGGTDGFGYWAPSWSPDGERLALLSNRDGDLGLHVWERAGEGLARVSERGVDVPPGVGAPFAVAPLPTWISDTELVFAVLPEGRESMAVASRRWAPSTAFEAWAAVREGTDATASILESGVPVDLTARPQGALLSYDAGTGVTTELLEGNVRRIVASPDGEWVAAFVDGPGMEQPAAGRPLALPWPYNRTETELRLVGRDGTRAAEVPASVRGSLRGYLEWAPDGSRFAFEGRTLGTGEPDGDGILVFTPATGALERPDLGNLTPVTPVRLRWSSDGRLIVFAREGEEGRADWWLLEGSGRTRNLTGILPAAPAQLYRVAGGAAWAGLVQGNLLRISEEAGPMPVSLTEALPDPISRLVWWDEAAAAREGIEELVVRTQSEDGDGDLVRVGLRGDPRVEIVAKPAPSANLTAYSAGPGLAAFDLEDRTGARLWLAPTGGGAPRLLFEANLFVREIAEGEVRRFDYESLDGDTLVAWVLLPPDGAPERAVDGRHPLVVRVYPHMRLGLDAPPWRAAEVHNPGFLSMQLLAAQGYAVLFPSMPRSGDPLPGLSSGVLPAVDRAVELGIADPERLAVMGESDGGYATYGLITQTDRFHAAIALWGATNLASYYGQFESELRYTGHPHEQGSRTHDLEAFQFALGGPPWEDLERYALNSPAAHLGRVETPVLMVHGDLDFIGIQQAEEFFTGLHRQGKRARFVRYWGEGHGLDSPANGRDMWRHVLDWLDEHLPDPDGTVSRDAARGGAEAG